MSALARQRWTLATALLVPLLVLAAPAPLQLDGTPPSWAVLWLLPWALVDGPLSGAAAGLGLALKWWLTQLASPTTRHALLTRL